MGRRRRATWRWQLVAVLGALALLAAACGGGGGGDTDAAGTDAADGGDDTTDAGEDGGDGEDGGGGGEEGRTIRIGYVSPQTGPLAGFGEADAWVVEQVGELLADGIDIGGTTHPVEILLVDSQSDPNNAAQVAGDLIIDREIDLMLVGSTPETTNPVSDQCELQGVPCISSLAPWQPWFFARGGDPEQGFEWTYHYFWGLEDIIAVFTEMWQSIDTNGTVAALWPNDGDGNAWSDPENGFPPALEAEGFEIVDPGRYENLTDDFSAQLTAFSSADADIVTGVPIPPDFTTFWTQAAQRDFRPRIASVGKALLFPSAVEALGDLGEGMSTEVWWSPSHPFTSSLSGQSAQELADAWEEGTGQQWTQPVGYVHSLFEVAVDVLQRTADVDDPAAIRDAIAETSLDTIVGPVDWTVEGPVPNVAKTPLVGGQWQAGDGEHQYELVIVSNGTAPDIPTGGELQPLPGSE